MQLEIQLDESHARKLTYIQQYSQQDLIDLINQAIDLRYQQLQSPDNDLLAKLKRSKFVGSFQGSADLSTNSKAILHTIMEEKQQHLPSNP
jgi:hypothetical protein